MAKPNLAERIKSLREKPISPRAGSWAMFLAGLVVSAIGGYLSLAVPKSPVAPLSGLVGWILVGLWFGYVRRLRRAEFIAAAAAVIFITCSGAVVTPVFLSAHIAAQMTQTRSRMKEVGIAVLGYVEEHDDRLPIADKWMDAAAPYTPDRIDFCDEEAGCTSVNGPVFGLAFNSDLSRSSLKDVDAQLPMLFELSGSLWNAAILASKAPGETGRRRSYVAHVDGHVGFQPMKSP